jgi:hypothetical protein
VRRRLTAPARPLTIAVDAGAGADPTGANAAWVGPRAAGAMLACSRRLPLLIGLTAALAACSSGAPPTSQASPTQSAAATQPAGATPGGDAGTPRCHTGDLSAAVRGLDPGAGQRHAVLVLTNRSGHACGAYGYVGMQLVDGAGAPVPTNIVRASPPSPAALTLAPGASAYTVLHWTVVSGPGDSQTGPCEPAPAAARVTPPDETSQVSVPWTLGFVCLQGRIDLGALAPGTGPTA